MKSDLYVTGKPAADRLLRNDGTALLIGMLLDQQVPMEWAFTGPFTIGVRLGHLVPSRIAAMNIDQFVAMCCEKPADRKSTRLNSSHTDISRMPSSA